MKDGGRFCGLGQGIVLKMAVQLCLGSFTHIQEIDAFQAKSHQCCMRIILGWLKSVVFNTDVWNEHRSRIETENQDCVLVDQFL